ncbi:MAG: hypothetical protein LUM44_15415 [Pyrinomonadaceae bacterium]|nr:hypothetical protein [Pyrinomonadaceae bacterium]
MRKHILGLAVFSFIFAFFAVAYAFIYAPSMPQGDAVEVFGVPVYKSERPSSCHKSAKKLSYEILSSQLDLQEGKLYTRVLLKWSGRRPAPKNLFVNVNLMVPSEEYSLYDSTNVVTAFNVGNTTEILLKSNLSNKFTKNYKNENIYAKYSFSEQFVNAKLDESYSNNFPVVVSHGKNSESVKKGKFIIR